MSSSEIRKPREDELSPPSTESDTAQREIDDAAWSNYRPDGGQQDHARSYLEASDQRRPDGRPEFDPGLSPDQQIIGIAPGSEPTEVWNRQEGEVEGEIGLDARFSHTSRDEIDDAAWANAEGALVSNDTVPEMESREARLADAQREVEEAYLNGKAPESTDAAATILIESEHPVMATGDDEWTGSPSADSRAYAGHEHTLHEMPLDELDYSDNPIQGDFEKGGATLSDYQWAAKAWESTIRTGVEQGLDRDSFAVEDTANDAESFRRLADAYDLFLGSDPIWASRQPGGGWSVGGGRHRIEAARRAGVKSLPVRLIQ
jgi:hypothetical protein